MKEYNCPDCNLQANTCVGCHRAQNIINILEKNENQFWNISFNYECCAQCPNNPKNGGSGVCHCTLPYMNGHGPYSITYTTTL